MKIKHGIRKITTGVSALTSSSKAPPGDVSPGHIIFAPARTNFIAPLSTCNFFIMFGSIEPDTLINYDGDRRISQNKQQMMKALQYR